MMVTTPVSLDIGQTVWFLGLAATGFLLLAADSVRARLLGLLPMAVGAAIALPLFPAAQANVLTVDTFAAEKVCDGPICLSRLHADSLGALAPPGREALALLAKLPGAPTRIEEQIAANRPDVAPQRAADVVHLDFQRDDLRTADAATLRLAVLAGAGLPSCNGWSRPTLPDQAARMITAAYFTGELKQLPEYGGSWLKDKLGTIERLWATFRALPPDVQLTRVAAARQVLLTCQGDPLEKLVSGGPR
jgi:hypothetical protein